MERELGLLVLRAVVGLLLVGHGAHKLLGWFGGYGLRGTGGYLAALGFRPGLLFAVAAGLAEAGGGALLALGLLTPLGGGLAISAMVNVAVAGHGEGGIWNHNGGYELPLLYGAGAAGLAIGGPGAYAPGPAPRARAGGPRRG